MSVEAPKAPKRHKTTYRKGQYIICKYNGSRNGDLIVGIVKSVRTNGDVILTNLLNDNRSTKHEDVLSRRNVVVSKKLAMRVLLAFAQARTLHGFDAARATARAEAVRVARALLKSPARKVSVRVKNLIAAFQNLNEEERNDFSRAVWGDVLAHFGVS